MATLYDAEQKLLKERADEIFEIGTGSCNNADKSADWLAMEYRHRIGVVDGLDKAIRIIKQLQGNEE